MKFRKKPVVIDAQQYVGFNAAEMIAWITAEGGTCTALDGFLFVVTLEGVIKALSGDWVIKGVKGEFYPCQPDIFEVTYDRVLESGEQIETVSITLPT